MAKPRLCASHAHKGMAVAEWEKAARSRYGRDFALWGLAIERSLVQAFVVGSSIRPWRACARPDTLY